MRFIRLLVKPARLLLRRSLSAPRRRLSVTLDGMVFIGLLLSIGLAAVNSGANLLYMVFSMMAGLMIFSGLASWRSLMGMRVERQTPRHITAGEKAVVALRVQNVKRLLYSYSLRIADLRDDGKPLGTCYVMRLKPRESVRLVYRALFERRGRHCLEGMRISTRFPFGFVEKSYWLKRPAEILVYPPMFPVKEFLEDQKIDLGPEETRRKGQGTNLYALRPYVQGDSARLIHWKATAKVGELIVREFETDDHRKVSLILDNAASPNRHKDLEEKFEQAVSCVASVTRDLLDRGFQVELLTRSGRVPFGVGIPHLRRVLRVLALIQMAQRDASLPLPRSPGPRTIALWFDYEEAPGARERISAAIQVLETRKFPWKNEAFPTLREAV
jgi:uncharacterized protein (DUF58 family)